MSFFGIWYQNLISFTFHRHNRKPAGKTLQHIFSVMSVYHVQLHPVSCLPVSSSCQFTKCHAKWSCATPSHPIHPTLHTQLDIRESQTSTAPNSCLLPQSVPHKQERPAKCLSFDRKQMQKSFRNLNVEMQSGIAGSCYGYRALHPNCTFSHFLDPTRPACTHDKRYFVSESKRHS